jgi:hypothetical protein
MALSNLPSHIISVLRLIILAARLVLWLTFTSGLVSVHILPDDVWLFGFAVMTTTHAIFDASYVAACTANLGAEPGFWDVVHILITLLDVQMARVITVNFAEGPDE